MKPISEKYKKIRTNFEKNKLDKVYLQKRKVAELGLDIFIANTNRAIADLQAAVEELKDE